MYCSKGNRGAIRERETEERLPGAKTTPFRHLELVAKDYKKALNQWHAQVDVMPVARASACG